MGPLKEVNIPNNPIPYLERSYGTKADPDKWKIPQNYYNTAHQRINIETLDIKEFDYAKYTIKILERKLDGTDNITILLEIDENDKISINFIPSNYKGLALLYNKKTQEYTNFQIDKTLRKEYRNSDNFVTLLLSKGKELYIENGLLKLKTNIDVNSAIDSGDTSMVPPIIKT